MSTRLLCCIAAICFIAATSCTERATAPLWQSTTVKVELKDNKIGINPTIPSGRVRFEVHNGGTHVHQMRVFPLPDESPPLIVQLTDHEAQTPHIVGNLVAVQRDATESFAVDLEPNRRYAALCFLDDDEKMPYALQGMNAEFRTEGKAN